MATGDSERIELEAAAWLARRDGEDWAAPDADALERWLTASTAHRVAFLRLESAWIEAGRLQALAAGRDLTTRGHWGPPDRRTAHTNATDTSGGAGAGDPSPHDLGERDLGERGRDFAALRFAPRAERPARARPGRWAAVAAVVALSASVGMGGWWRWREDAAVERAAYATALGALETVRLTDGSQATLSSDSRIDVALSRRERRIELRNGEALFEAAKDASRPFVVIAGDRRVVAVGTRFSVRRDRDVLRVVVAEGTVRLETRQPDGRPGPDTLLPAGSLALASAAGIAVRRDAPAAAARALEWREGYLRFEDTPLREAAEEFNRFNARKLLMGDADVAALRMGGQFRWSNLDGFVRLLQQGFGVRVEERGDFIVLHRR